MQREQLLQRITTNLANNFGPNVFPYDLSQAAEDRLNPQRADEQYEIMQRYIPGNLTGKHLLEVGASYSSYQSYLKEQGLIPMGIEPDREALEMGWYAWDNLRDGLTVIEAVGEMLPFPDNHFDIVFSSNVLEHVQDPKAVIDEAIRVLKPDGYLHFIFPNYGSVWDGHYATFWIPYAPASIIKFYLKLLGRSPHYVDTLQLINIFTVRRILKPHRNIRVISMGEEVFEERLRTQVSNWSGMNRLSAIVRVLQRLCLVGLIEKISRLLVMHTPFILTLQKTK